MALRTTTYILKNSDIVSRPLPSILLKGEPIINTADGIMYLSGTSQSTNNWTPAGTGTTANFFEVGSNLYDLKIRHQITAYSGLTNLSGKFLSGTTNGFVLADISSIVGVDTYVTGFTYNSANNTFTIKQNQGQPDLSTQFTTVSGISISNLTANRLVYTTTGGQLVTGTAIFDGTNMTLPAAGNLTVGTGGLVVGSGGSYGIPGSGDVVINGNLTVYGSAISAFTSQLYVEDNNIILNYSPTGSTSGTSIGAGWTIQDGNGTTGGDVNLDIRAMNGFTGLTATQVPNVTEYSGTTGYTNRAFVTQLNDIVIRSTNITTPNGVRVLTEFDVLDGGSY